MSNMSSKEYLLSIAGVFESPTVYVTVTIERMRDGAVLDSHTDTLNVYCVGEEIDEYLKANPVTKDEYVRLIVSDIDA